MKYVLVVSLMVILSGCGRSSSSPQWDEKMLYQKDGCAWLVRHHAVDTFFLDRLPDEDLPECKKP